MKRFSYIVLMLLLSLGVSAQQWKPSMDPLDTLDEVDIFAIKDTIKLPRLNLAKKFSKNVNTMDYLLGDVFPRRFDPVTKKSYQQKFSLWENIYFGAGFGFEFLQEQSNDYPMGTIKQFGIYAGKEFTSEHSVRLGLGGGYQHIQAAGRWIGRVSISADYLFNVSNHFASYNPTRKLDVSLLAGGGLHFTKWHGQPTKTAPEAHVGVQFKIFAGPRNYINVEPYVGIGSDQLDYSGTRNWKNYDIFWGIRGNYTFFLDDNLSKVQRTKLILNRKPGEEMISDKLMEKWRTPYFVEFASGMTMPKSSHDVSGSIGNQTRISIGRWFSPVAGFRASLASRANSHYEVVTPAATELNADRTATYYTYYYSGRLEALLNPVAFFQKNFTWDNTWGGFLVVGAEVGMRQYCEPDVNIQKTCLTYSGGIHLWRKMTNDLQFFVEPRYNFSNQGLPYGTAHLKGDEWVDRSFSVEMGFTMLLRSQRFRSVFDMDDVQAYTYDKEIKGFRIGAAVGLSMLSRRQVSYGSGSLPWTAMGFLEYRFNPLYSVRGQLELMNFKSTDLFSISVKGANKSATLPKKFDPHALYDCSERVLFASLDAEVSVSNLFGGKSKDRMFEMEAFAGPSACFVSGREWVMNSAEPLASNGNFIVTRNPGDQAEGRNLYFGFNFGLKLTTHVFDRFDAFFTPTVYFIHKPIGECDPAASTVQLNGFRLYQSFNIGLQYKIGKIRLNPAKRRARYLLKLREWRYKQIRKTNEREDKMQRIHEKRQEALSK